MSFIDAIRRFIKPTPEEKAERLRKRITNMYGHTEDRRYALGQLYDLGPELAPRRLIERFTRRCDNGTIDAEEKAYTKDLLVSLGEGSIEPLKQFLMKNDKDFSWPYRTLAELLDHESLVSFLETLLKSIGPEYVRDPERKEQLILTVKSFEEPCLDDALLPYLGDENETIRFVAADAVIEHGRPEGIDALSARLGEETSQRTLSLIATAFRDKGWLVSEAHRASAVDHLPKGFRLNDKGAVI